MPYHSQILYVDPGDDVKKIRGKIQKASKEKVVLVLPEENRNLKNIENLTILKKEAQDSGKQLAIFSSDIQYKKLAEDCGIEIEKLLVKGSFADKREMAFRPKMRDILQKKKIIEKSFPQKELKSEKELFVKEKVTASSFPQAPSSKKRWISLLAYIFLFVLVAGGIFYSIVYLPRANIEIIPASEEVEFSGEFAVFKDVSFDIEKRIISAVLIEKEEKEVQKSFLTSGEKKKVEKAEGTITVYNKSASAHTWKSSRFETSDGKIFWSKEWISIPAGSEENPGTAEIEIVAAESGEEYNIGPTDFTVPALKEQGRMVLYEQIYAESTEPMKGGFDGVTKVVTEEDIEKAKDEMLKLEANLAEEAKNEVLEELSESLQFLLEDSILIEKEEISFDKEIDDAGETFKGKAVVRAKILSFDEDQVQEIIAEIVKGKIKENIDVKEVVSTQDIKYELLKMDIGKGEMKIGFEGNEKVAWEVVSQDIKDKVFGMKGSDFENYIEEDMKGKIKNGKLEFWPFWVNEVPQRQERVFIEVKYE